jgi:phenylacetate-CoA ligase
MRLDTSARADAILAVIRKLKGVYEQVLIVGEHPFLKKVLEDGLDAGINWPEHRVSLLTGAEVVPESFRTYAGAILGHDPADPQNGQILISAGISEVGLTIGHETDGCRRLRMTAAREEALRDVLFGQTPFLPTCVQYFPDALYVETPDVNGRSTLVVTTSSPRRKLPLIRYCTGDWAKAFTHQEVCQALDACGRSDLRPSIKLPFLFLWGRGRCIKVAGREVFPEQIKEAIYSDVAVTTATTANFRMSEKAGQLHITFQLKPNAMGSEALRQAFTAALLSTSGLRAEPRLVPFEEFPVALELSYQRKFQYL